jgi:hypothetical protein
LAITIYMGLLFDSTTELTSLMNPFNESSLLILVSIERRTLLIYDEVAIMCIAHQILAIDSH